MKRFGYAIRIGGDAEISGALAAGMERGTGSLRRFAPPPSQREALGPRAKEGLRRVAMYQHSPEEWAEMIEDARVVYGGQRATPKALQWLVVGYAVICTTIERCYRYLSAWNREG